MTGPNRAAQTDRRTRKSRPKAKAMEFGVYICERCGALVLDGECTNCGWLAQQAYETRPIAPFGRR